MKKFLVSGLVVMMFVAGGAAQAASVSFNINTFISGDANTLGYGYLNATFSDYSEDVVQLKVTSYLTEGERLDQNQKGLYFNLNPSLDVANLSLDNTTPATVELVTNGLKADGSSGAYFDIMFKYLDLTYGTPQTYLLKYSGIGTFDANSFNFPSILDPNKNNSTSNWYAAAHVLLPTSTQSVWLGSTGDPVPVPPTVWLFGSSLLGLLGFKRKILG